VDPGTCLLFSLLHICNTSSTRNELELMSARHSGSTHLMSIAVQACKLWRTRGYLYPGKWSEVHPNGRAASIRAQRTRPGRVSDETREMDEVSFRSSMLSLSCSGSEAFRKKKGSKHILPTPVSLMPAHQLASQPHLTLLDQRNLSLGLEGLGEAAHVVLEGTLGAEELDVGTVDADLALLALLDVLLAAKGGETPVLGDDDLLATGELVLGATESLNDVGADWIFC